MPRGKRRWFLVAGVLGIVSTAPRARGTDTEVEAVGYGGTSTGGWVCGPLATARYGGGVVRVEHGEREERNTEEGGFTGIGTLALEHEQSSLVNCDDDCELPPDRLMFGASAQGAFESDIAGVKLGGGLYQGWRSNRSRTPAMAIYPEIEVGLRLRSPVRAVIGVGSSVATTVRRPGGYLGADLLFAPLTVELRVGAHRAGPPVFSDVNARADAVAALALFEYLDLRVGGSVSESSEAPVTGEGSAGVRVRF